MLLVSGSEVPGLLGIMTIVGWGVSVSGVVLICRKLALSLTGFGCDVMKCKLVLGSCDSILQGLTVLAVAKFLNSGTVTRTRFLGYVAVYVVDCGMKDDFVWEVLLGFMLSYVLWLVGWGT